MLAFQDQDKYPYQDQINDTQLCRITAKINNELNKHKDSKLAQLLRLMMWGQENLLAYYNSPQLEDIPNGGIIQNYSDKLDVLRDDHHPVVLRGEALQGQQAMEEEEEDEDEEVFESDHQESDNV